MRDHLYCASYLVLAAALAVAAFAASSQTNHTTLAQTGNGAITVPPGVARGYGNYADGTPCIGTPKDPTAFPDKKTNPCDGNPATGYDFQEEPGDPAKGEDTIVSAYERASGRLTYRNIIYRDGEVVIQYFRRQDGTLRVELELVPDMSHTVAYFLKRVTTYAADGVSKVRESRYRPDLTVEEVDDWPARGFVRSYYDIDGTTVVRKVNFDKDANPILKHQDKP